MAEELSDVFNKGFKAEGLPVTSTVSKDGSIKIRMSEDQKQKEND